MRISRATLRFLLLAGFLVLLAGFFVWRQTDWKIVIAVMAVAWVCCSAVDRAFARRARRVAAAGHAALPMAPAPSRAGRSGRRAPAHKPLERAPMTSPLQRGRGFRGPAKERVPVGARIRPKKSYGVRRERPERITLGNRMRLWRERRPALQRRTGGRMSLWSRF